MAKILITGGSGLIGRALSAKLLINGHQVVWLSRTPGKWKGIDIFKWDPKKSFIDTDSLSDITHVINLAGTSIAAKRWTRSFKSEILESRINAAELLLDEIVKSGIKLRNLLEFRQ